MFPFDIDEEEITVESNEQIPTDYEIDFATGKLTGRIITGLDAIIQWIKLALSTDRYNFNQFSWDYGLELSSLIGQSNDEAYIKSEAKRMIEEVVSIDDSILGIENVECKIDGDVLTVSFHVNTIYGGGTVNV